MSNDSIKWSCDWAVDKYDEDDVARLTQQLGREPTHADFQARQIGHEHLVVHGNQLLTNGLTRITSLMTGGGGQTIINTSTRVGVGDATTTVSVADTDLSAVAGPTHRQFIPLDATYPTITGGIMAFVTTFGPTFANFAWNEFGIDVGTPTVTAGTTVNALLLNRKVLSGLGTKTSGQTWVAAAQISLS